MRETWLPNKSFVYPMNTQDSFWLKAYETLDCYTRTSPVLQQPGLVVHQKNASENRNGIFFNTRETQSSKREAHNSFFYSAFKTCGSLIVVINFYSSELFGSPKTVSFFFASYILNYLIVQRYFMRWITESVNNQSPDNKITDKTI